MLEDHLSGIELQGSGATHVLCVGQVGDGEVQGEGHQSGASGYSEGGREECPAWTTVRTEVAWSSYSEVPAMHLSIALDCRSWSREHYGILKTLGTFPHFIQ